MHAELALDAEGKFLAVRLQGYGNLGAYITGVAPGPPVAQHPAESGSVYRTPLLGVDIKTVLTNTTLMGAYRGAAGPRPNYYMERLIDRAADEMGINRLTQRSATSSSRRNCRSPPPPASPMTAAILPASSQALEISTTPILARRKKESKKDGNCAASRWAPISRSRHRRAANSQDHLRPDGSVKLTPERWITARPRHTVRAGAVAQLGVPLRRSRSSRRQRPRPFGNGTGGSRSITATDRRSSILRAVVERASRPQPI